jgi:hypothetical protein
MSNGLLNSLVAYYKLDAAGLTADSKGAATLTNNQTVTTTTGKINEAASFAGTNQNLASAASALNLTGTMSLSLWTKPNSVSAGTKCLSCNSRVSSGNGLWVVEINRTAGKITILSHDQNAVSITSSATLSASTWTHILVTRSGSSGAWTWKLYLNGSLDSTASDASNPSATGVTFVLGAYDNNSANYNGLLDEYGLWSVALGATDATNLYNGGSGLAFSSFDAGGGGGGVTVGADALHYYREHVMRGAA